MNEIKSVPTNKMKQHKLVRFLESIKLHNLGFLLESEGIIFIFLICLIIFTGSIEKRFLSISNFVTLSKQASYLLICAIGQMSVLLVGGFDLSQAGVISFVSFMSASIMISSNSIGLGMFLGMFLAVLVGLTNGMVVAIFNVSPLITTLAMQSIISGLALIFSGGGPIFGLPTFFNQIFSLRKILGLALPTYIAIIITVLMFIFFNDSRQGKYFYAIGDNIEAAKIAGIRTRLYLVLAYTLSSFFAGIAALLLTARVNCGEPILGANMSLKALTAAVLGGVSLKGGKGTVVGVFLGAIFITVLGNAMDLLRIGSYFQMVVLGLLLVFAMILDTELHKK